MAVAFTSTKRQVIIAKGRVVYQPSVYNANGNETRLNLVLEVEPIVRNQLAAIEASMDLGPTMCSVIKPDTIKVKVDTDLVRCFDSDHNKISAPAKWADAMVEARIEVRGTFKTASNCGLAVCCTDIRFCSDQTESPFK